MTFGTLAGVHAEVEALLALVAAAEALRAE